MRRDEYHNKTNNSLNIGNWRVWNEKRNKQHTQRKMYIKTCFGWVHCAQSAPSINRASVLPSLMRQNSFTFAIHRYTYDRPSHGCVQFRSNLFSYFCTLWSLDQFKSSSKNNFPFQSKLRLYHRIRVTITAFNLRISIIFPVHFEFRSCWIRTLFSEKKILPKLVVQ